jgi:hypothetical protein
MADKEKLLDGFTGGITGLFIGPPGTGKSNLLGSIGEIVPASEVALLCPKPNEANSAEYRKYGFKAEIFRDHRWRPEAKMFEADGWSRLLNRVYDLYDDKEKRVVLLDPMTDAVMLAAHQILKGEQAPTLNQLRDKLSYYQSMKAMMKDLLSALTGLASPDLPRPKHVFVSVHAQPAKEDDIKGNATAEKEAKGITYFGDVMPALEGSIRQEVAGDFDIVGYTTVKHENVKIQEGAKVRFERKTSYLVQLTPDNERHAKVRLARGLEKEMENNLPKLLRAVLAAEKAGAA